MAPCQFAEWKVFHLTMVWFWFRNIKKIELISNEMQKYGTFQILLGIFPLFLEHVYSSEMCVLQQTCYLILTEGDFFPATY